MATKKRLSELEAVVLGLIRTEGPCTSYAVRRTVMESLSAQWSGSAGAVYPVVKRLRERGLIRTRVQNEGKRRSESLELSAGGLRALQAWLSPPIDSTALGIPPDPLRVRLRFLSLLPVDEQRRFIAEAEAAIAEGIRLVGSDLRRKLGDGSSPYQVAMANGALLAMRARRKMLADLLASLDG